MTKKEMENNLAEANRNLREIKDHLQNNQEKEAVKICKDIGDIITLIRKLDEPLHYL